MTTSCNVIENAVTLNSSNGVVHFTSSFRVNHHVMADMVNYSVAASEADFFFTNLSMFKMLAS